MKYIQNALKNSHTYPTHTLSTYAKRNNIFFWFVSKIIKKKKNTRHQKFIIRRFKKKCNKKKLYFRIKILIIASKWMDLFQIKICDVFNLNLKKRKKNMLEIFGIWKSNSVSMKKVYGIKQKEFFFSSLDGTVRFLIIFFFFCQWNSSIFCFS